MGKQGVEEMIDEIEVFIESCKYQPLSSNKIVVPKDELERMLNELKLKLPSEIERCKKIMRNKEAILASARTRSDAIISESVNEANRLVDTNHITELANARANEILESARSEAQQIVDDANAEATAAPKSFELADEYKKDYVNNTNYNEADYNNDADVMPTTGAKNGLKLEQLRGLDYDDPTWDTLLDEMSVSEMNTLIELGGYETSAVESIGKVMTYDCDGPASINNNFTHQGSIGFPAAVMIACTWNKDIAHRFGASIGRMANDMDVSGWYAPATNTHRSAFAGRNFEYYSEDGVLAGWMCANAVQGAREWGVYSYVKHFATNDQETNRTGLLCTWLNEQSLREIYLKSFEIAFKNGNPGATMVAFNNIGIEPAEACSALLNTVLRGEWGFRGFAETDYFGGYGYQDADRMIRNGCDLMLATYSTPESTVTDQTSATSLNAMRTASKNILYTVVNSRAYDKAVNTGLPTWVKILYGVDVLLIACIGFLEYRAVKAYLAKKKEEEPAVEQQTQE